MGFVSSRPKLSCMWPAPGWPAGVQHAYVRSAPAPGPSNSTSASDKRNFPGPGAGGFFWAAWAKHRYPPRPPPRKGPLPANPLHTAGSYIFLCVYIVAGRARHWPDVDSCQIRRDIIISKSCKAIMRARNYRYT